MLQVQHVKFLALGGVNADRYAQPVYRLRLLKRDRHSVTTGTGLRRRFCYAEHGRARAGQPLVKKQPEIPSGRSLKSLP